MKPILSAYYDTSDDPTQGERSVKKETMGVHLVLESSPMAPNITPIERNPKITFALIPTLNPKVEDQSITDWEKLNTVVGNPGRLVPNPKEKN